MTAKNDKGVAGLSIFLALIVFLFIIGLIVMVFSLMAGGLRDATYTLTSGTVANETGWLNNSGYTLAQSTLNSFSATITQVRNNTDGTVLLSGNYSLTGSKIYNASTITYSNASVTYSYTYNANNDATDVINDTSSAIGKVTDWFGLFVTIGAMVVLVLLVVLIVTALKGSGIMGGSSGSGPSGETA